MIQLLAWLCNHSIGETPNIFDSKLMRYPFCQFPRKLRDKCETCSNTVTKKSAAASRAGTPTPRHHAASAQGAKSAQCRSSSTPDIRPSAEHSHDAPTPIAPVQGAPRDRCGRKNSSACQDHDSALYFSNILAVCSSLSPRGTLSVSHPAPFQCLARKTICPVW